MFLDMMVQTEQTPNPNTLKFLPGKKVSEAGSVEFWKKDKNIKVSLVKNILSLNGTVMVFLGSDFITVKKEENHKWDDLKHSVISQINDYYLKGNDVVVEKNFLTSDQDTPTKSDEVIDKINEILNSKVRPAVARDGGDIKFKSFKDGILHVELQGSCSGCPSSVMTLKQGVENLLRHYVPEVKQVEAD